jgi:hypothetical protein
MSSTSLLRIAARAQPSTFFRANGLRSLTPRSSSALYAVPALIATSGSISSFSTSSVRLSDKDVQEAGHHEESFEEFTARYAVPNWRRELLSMFCRAEPKRRNDARQQLSSIANHLVPIYRYEKEFDQVQDVFELQV